ncbi:MAG: hypothetical protein JSV68_01250 [Anaerolineaceae bacterium]|nr:MAG: hypothetical protein JSV68_01250 [Anaerolineaceae bacterium]
MPDAQIKLTTRLMRTVLYVASILVLAVSISLYFLPGRTDTYFSWTINPPLTAAFLGAGYLASFILEFLSARERVWANARTAVPAVWVFTFLTLLVTLAHFDRFHFSAPQLITVIGTWFWLLVYAGVPIVMGIAWILQARSPGTDPLRLSPLPTLLRVILVIQGFMMLLVGVVMVISPQAIIPYWPWTLSALTCRAIGAWGVGIGIIAIQASWENEWVRLRPMMISYMVYGVLQLLNLLRFLEEPDWTLPSAWAYALFVLSIFLVGLYGVIHIRRSNVPTA